VRAFGVDAHPAERLGYYQVVEDADGPFLRGAYRPPLDTVTLSVRVPDELRTRVRAVRWRWRAMTLPVGGDECHPDRTDSSAAVYLAFRGRLRWFALKYVWSAVGVPGRVCARKRNPFSAQDSIILRSGPPVGEWVTEEIDPTAEFRAHFAQGANPGDVPELVGIAILTDGDQTKSASAADYADFTLVH
jgi:hypothetical protein